jgi:hypothetical protein
MGFINQEDIPVSVWPMCAIKGCKNRCCRSIGSEYCFPHSQDKLDLDYFVKKVKVKA